MAVIKPILRIFDYDKTIEFYVDWLGCKIELTHVFEPGMSGFMQVSLKDVQFNLSEYHGDASPGVHISIVDFEGLKDYRAEFIAKKYKYNRPGLEVPFCD